jgi:hypothetical protein
MIQAIVHIIFDVNVTNRSCEILGACTPLHPRRGSAYAEAFSLFNRPLRILT